MVRFSANEYSPHTDCSEMGPMDFPPIHYYAPLCIACNVENFLENGEFIRWAFTILAIVEEPYASQRLTDEYLFWTDWLQALKEAAFKP